MRSILIGLVWESRAKANSFKRYGCFGRCTFGSSIEVPDNIIHPSFNINSKLTAQVDAEGANTFAFNVKKKYAAYRWCWEPNKQASCCLPITKRNSQVLSFGFIILRTSSTRLKFIVFASYGITPNPFSSHRVHR
jgi:hypothetical protein